MVEFCTVCGTSLPKGDLTVKGGKVFTSHDYNTGRTVPVTMTSSF